METVTYTHVNPTALQRPAPISTRRNLGAISAEDAISAAEDPPVGLRRRLEELGVSTGLL